MKKQKRIKYIAAVMGICLMMLQGVSVAAAQGRVTFGSAAYNWYTGQVCPLGVYVKSEVPVATYEICLEYDEAMLRYLDGADEVSGNRIYIRGSGEELVYKTMLHFEPLQEGTTQVQVVSALCTAAGDITDGNADQTLEMTELSAAPITVRRMVSDRLRMMQIAGEDWEAFSPDVLEYTLSVEAAVQELLLIYEPEDEEAVVTLSDTRLQTGENTITLSVKGTAAEEKVYTLHVIREEAPILPEESQESQPEETQESQPEETQPEESQPEKTQEDQPKQPQESQIDAVLQLFLSNPVLWSMTALTALLCLVYFIHFLINRKPQTLAAAKEDEDDVKIINLEQTVIAVQHVTMQFKMAQDEASSLKEYVIRALKGQNHYQYLTALDDISFDVKQGDVVGIIGTNGSGKSTLLKVVSGALSPTEGSVEVDRSKVHMLTLGTGFDMELTARENVYLNGAIIGYEREYIDAKYDEIVRFAELEGFMEERMKNFSSGMVSRLGFAIATVRDTPDILILDEVLSVGDQFFREKSMERIRQMIHGGATVLMVSHSTDVIIKNCNRAVWIEKGVLQMVGEPKEVCGAYERYELQG